MYKVNYLIGGIDIRKIEKTVPKPDSIISFNEF
jgi:hypothetical protein